MLCYVTLRYVTLRYVMFFYLILSYFILHLSLQIAGVTTALAALLLKFNSGYLDSEVTSMLNKINVDTVPLGTLTDANVYVMIGAGAVIMFISVLGLCGAWHGIKGCLYLVFFMDI